MNDERKTTTQHKDNKKYDKDNLVGSTTRTCSLTLSNNSGSQITNAALKHTMGGLPSYD